MACSYVRCGRWFVRGIAGFFVRRNTRRDTTCISTSESRLVFCRSATVGSFTEEVVLYGLHQFNLKSGSFFSQKKALGNMLIY